MSWVAAAVIGSAAVGAIGSTIAASNQADAAKSAAQSQLQATTQGQDLLREMYAKNAPYWQPYANLGPQGTTAISQMMPYLTHQFNASDLQSNLAPNYQFMLGQGLGATRQAQNVGGGGSNQTRAADIFAQNYAQNAYQNAFQNYQSQRTGIYNTLASIANIGQQGAAGISNLGAGVATNIANLGVQGATAYGAGQVGAANAWSGAAQNIGNTVSNAGMLYGLTGGFGGSTGGQVTGTPYTSPTMTAAGTQNVGGAPMTITPLG